MENIGWKDVGQVWGVGYGVWGVKRSAAWVFRVKSVLPLLAGTLPFTILALLVPVRGTAQTINVVNNVVNGGQVPAASTVSLSPAQPLPPQDVIPRPVPSPTLPEPPLAPVPPAQLLPTPPSQQPPEPPTDLPPRFRVTGFKFEGSSVFSDRQLLDAIAAALKLQPAELLPREFTFDELLAARTAITKLYIDHHYITSGALIPAEQTIPPTGGEVRMQIVEGSIEEIKVTGTRRLAPGYISSRLGIAVQKPLNQQQLLDALQLLSQSPFIEKISAELAAGSRFGSNLLEVTVKEAPTFHAQIGLDNDRSPAVGSFRRSITFSDDNLVGLGDSLSLAYANTDGSNEVDLNYTVPVSPHDTTLQFHYSAILSNVIEAPFNLLDITSKYRIYELTFRQPLIKKPNEELALGLTFSREETETALGFENIGPFPLSPGADPNGHTRLSVLRFFQEFTERKANSVLALRSEFDFGLNLFNATLQEIPPDGEFFVWRGQAQWVYLLGPDTPLILRGNLQVADRPLVAIEQFSLGDN